MSAVLENGMTKERLQEIVNKVTEDTGCIATYQGQDFLIIDSYEQEKEIERLTGMRMYDVMQELDLDYGYSDEWTLCSECGEIIRISPDSYSWLPDFIVTDGEILCHDCITPNRLLCDDSEDSFINNPRKALSPQLITMADIEAEGFILIDENFESGWYGRTDSPQDIYDALKDSYEEVLFYITGSGQFHTDFQVFVRNKLD